MKIEYILFDFHGDNHEENMGSVGKMLHCKTRPSITGI
jgi:hypothetical protein